MLPYMGSDAQTAWEVRQLPVEQAATQTEGGVRTKLLLFFKEFQVLYAEKELPYCQLWGKKH